MTIQITIVGLGQIGGSIGLALAEKEDLLQRVGHDREHIIAQQAKKINAVDKVSINLLNAVENADLVVLALPIDQIYETMQLIARDLKENAVLLDTGPVKETVAIWAQEILPENRHYVGLTPVINPEYLHRLDSGLEAARADLFHGGLMAIAASASTNSEAIKLAADLTRLLGASAMFADPVEIDGLMAATHMLPQVLSAALLNATIDQPGWREGRKVAGRAYAEASAPIVSLDDTKTLRTSMMLNRQNVIRVMDSTIASLQVLRADLDAQDNDALDERLERAKRGRNKWWEERQAGDWTGIEGTQKIEYPSVASFFSRMLGIRRRSKPKKEDQESNQ
jgi:prephenate dehydrogenase